MKVHPEMFMKTKGEGKSRCQVQGVGFQVKGERTGGNGIRIAIASLGSA
jgi:hypothetical protein